MKFFIDTAMVEEIRSANELGMLDGVTTNPSLIAKTGRPAKEVVKEICGIVKGPVSAEALSEDYEGIVREALEWRGVAENIAVKIPITEAGLKATKALASEGVMVNMTLVFHPVQALMAAKAGAAFVSPFVGRLDDISTDGMALIEDIIEIYNNYDFDTEVIVASIRHPMHVVEAARIGADIATIPYNVIKQLLRHPLTEIGIERFLKDAGVRK
ncbi:MAG: fructose-6-phosphate aldolase [Myxococcota bacterium]